MTEQNTFAIAELQQKANEGDAQAQFDLALCYANGKDVEKNEGLAFEWHKKAAEQGHVDAQFALGLFYLLSMDNLHKQQINGLIQKWSRNKSLTENLWVIDLARNANIGLTVDLDPAIDLAATQAFSTKGTSANDDLAFVWLKNAAEQNRAEASYWLGQCYLNGIGAEQNNELAFDRFKKAAEQGLAESQYALACCFFDGIGTKHSDDLGLKWCEKAAISDTPEAQYLLACWYLDGNNAVQNLEQGLLWLMKAAEKKFTQAEVRLAVCYEYGIGVEMSITQAFALRTAVADEGHAESQCWLAQYYLRGGIFEMLIGYEKDAMENNPAYWRNIYLKIGQEHAFSWANKAVENGYGDAYLLLAFMYLYGIGVDQSEKRAFDYFKNAAEYNQDGIADYFLADFYTQTKGVEQSDKLATYYSQRANHEKVRLFYNIEGLLKNADEKLKIKLLRLSINLHIECEDFDLARAEIKEHASDNTDEMNFSLDYIDKTEQVKQEIKQKNALYKALHEKEKEMLSFFTHTMRNALATAPESLRQAIRILGSEDYEKNQKHYEAINEITALFSTLTLTDCLIDTFKQSIYDTEEFKRAWQQDNTGDASPEWFIAAALRQSLNRIIFMEDATGLRKLINNQGELIKPTRKAFIEQVLPLDVNQRDVEKFYHWLQSITALEVTVEKSTVQFGANQIKFSLMFAISSELILNALKYWSGTGKIQIDWRIEPEHYIFSVSNACKANAGSQLAGTHKGVAFINRLIELLGEQAQFNCSANEQLFSAELILHKTLLGG